MASPSQLHSALTLEEFLRLPEIDEHPYLEFIEGRIEAKVSPQKKHSLITMGLIRCIDDYSLLRRLGRCFVELRCTFGGRSIIPDIVFLTPEHVLVDENGDAINETLLAPDIHIEIISPDQSPRRAREKLRFSTSHGCPLGWLIDPERRTIDVYEEGVPPERLPDDGCLDGGLSIPNFRLSIAEVFQWMRPFVPRPQGEQPLSPGEAGS